MKRHYTAPLDSERCKASITCGKVAAEGARCMKRKALDSDYCKQHSVKYRVHSSSVDLDGWWKFTLITDDGREVAASRKRMAALRRNGQIVV